MEVDLLLGIVAALAPFAHLALQDARPAEEPAKLGACVVQIDGLREPTGVDYGPDGLLYACESLAQRVSAIDAAGKTVRTIGAGSLVDPRDVAVSSDGLVFVSDAATHSIRVFGKDGKELTPIGKRGPGPGQLHAPEGIDVAGPLVAIADAGNDRVQVLRFDGSLACGFGSRGQGEGRLNHPTDVAFAPDGSLFVCDLFNQRVQQYSKEGKFLRAFGTPGPNPGQFGGPTGLALHGGFVHVVDRDNSRVEVFTLAGELHSWYGIHALRPREGQGKLHYPLRLALSADGTRCAIAEPMEDRVQVLGPVDPNAEELPPLPALPPSHYGGAIDADGPILALTEPSIPKVLLFQMLDGEPIEFGSFGTYGSRTGQMLWPSDVAVDFARRRVYVADTGLGRILEFEFKFDPAAEIGFDPERVRFVAEIDDLDSLVFGESADKTVEPAGLWRDGDGGLCVADPHQRVVWRLDAALEMQGVARLPDACRDPIDGCAGPRGEGAKPAREQYVVDRLGGRVFALGTGKTVAEGFARPSAALLTQAGELYVSDEGANALVRAGREPLAVAKGPGLGPLELFRPRGLAELAGGRVVVLDWGNHRGSIFDRSGHFVRAFGSQLFIRPTIKSRQEKVAEPPLAAVQPPTAAQFPVLDGSQPWHSAEHVVSNAGHYAVFWRPDPGPIRERESFALDVWVTALATPNELAKDLGLDLDAAMPEHGHGMNVLPRTQRAADGHFVVEGTRLHMPGRWEVYFDIQSGWRTERAQITLVLE